MADAGNGGGGREGFVMAVIIPGPEGESPTFKILRDHQRDENIRPCDHRSFVLDEKWMTVTCGECGDRVDAFAALMKYADWWQKMESRRAQMEEAEKNMLRESLRRLSRLRAATEEERDEIARVIGWAGDSKPVAELREVERRIDRAIRERKRAADPTFNPTLRALGTTPGGAHG